NVFRINPPPLKRIQKLYEVIHMKYDKYDMILNSVHATAVRCRDEGLPIGETTLRALIHSGELKAYRVGKNKQRVLVNWHDVLQYFGIEKKKRKSSGEGGGA
ncbi:helix-turn-helix domain-containing protein, partial [Ruminococcaceae bacterium OttesenSCG-928-D13]|nr:helix-turn-helix domain-containing protein [Ruminococcaceae bacterium OttesenSCG-928-D13]